MTKAQVGDLIRITKRVGSELGNIYEVAQVDGDRAYVGEVFGNGMQLYFFSNEYEIHRKAGEEGTPYDTLIAQGHRGIEQFHAQMHKGERVVPSDKCRPARGFLAEIRSESDAVNPNHYKQGRVEVIDIIEDAVQGADPFEAVCQANILKYTLRYRHKNGTTDLRKMLWYGEKLVAYLDAKSTQD